MAKRCRKRRTKGSKGGWSIKKKNRDASKSDTTDQTKSKPTFGPACRDGEKPKHHGEAAWKKFIFTCR
ncbi:hypothetical protein ZHAS_00022051 [Anopheles sinensis]|uniref:Uncharacterized protein n=1 Tax=Anopheles sinensis TaxID=74873 RepID=A0A084WUB8_ANOSI|nr:hypothetical protein ZHAS_00022051 [Anopheles sinensis]